MIRGPHLDLAPLNKRGLPLRSPILAGSGAVGYADVWPYGLTADFFGAIVTSPVSLRPRRGGAPPRLAEVPGGYLLTAGDHNPGYRRIASDHLGRWRRLTRPDSTELIPIVMALASSTPEDWDRLAEHCDDEPAIAGLELHLPAEARPADIAGWITAARRATTLPLLARLPVTAAVTWAPFAVSSGADALVVGLPPSGALPLTWLDPTHEPGDDRQVLTGALGGPAAFPFTYHALRGVAALGLNVPLVAAGGLYSIEQADACLAAGAEAVQIRGLLWNDPAAAAALAEHYFPSVTS